MARPVLTLPGETQDHLRRLAGGDDPQRRDDYLAALYDAGWPYAAAATVLGLARETIREWAQKGFPDADKLPPVPQPPERPEPPQRLSWGELTDPERRQLRALQNLASELRGHHDLDAPERRASEDLSAMIDELTTRKDGRLTYAQIGEAMGVRPMTVRARLKRHGYRTTNPTLRQYGAARREAQEADA